MVGVLRGCLVQMNHRAAVDDQQATPVRLDTQVQAIGQFAFRRGSELVDPAGTSWWGGK